MCMHALLYIYTELLHIHTVGGFWVNKTSCCIYTYTYYSKGYRDVCA